MENYSDILNHLLTQTENEVVELTKTYKIWNKITTK